MTLIVDQAASSSEVWAKLRHIEGVLSMVCRLLNRVREGTSWAGHMGLKSTPDLVWNPIAHSHYPLIGLWADSKMVVFPTETVLGLRPLTQCPGAATFIDEI